MGVREIAVQVDRPLVVSYRPIEVAGLKGGVTQVGHRAVMLGINLQAAVELRTCGLEVAFVYEGGAADVGPFCTEQDMSSHVDRIAYHLSSALDIIVARIEHSFVS